MYTALLLATGRAAEPLDSNDSLDGLIGELVSFGWESDPAQSPEESIIVRDTQGKTVAKLVWFPVDGEEFPHLMVVRTDLRSHAIYRREDDTERAYRPALVA